MAMSRENGSASSGGSGDIAAVQRFPLLPATRYLVPVAVVLGVLGAALASGTRPRLVYLGGTALVLGLYALGRRARPVLAVDAAGYSVEARGRRHVRVRVLWGDVLGVRAVPDEEAMYVDTGDPAKNLLLPMRNGFGFRFQRQAALYALLAERLADKIEIVERLVEDPETPPAAPIPPGPPQRPVTNGHNRPKS